LAGEKSSSNSGKEVLYMGTLCCIDLKLGQDGVLEMRMSIIHLIIDRQAWYKFRSGDDEINAVSLGDKISLLQGQKMIPPGTRLRTLLLQ
jgi:hypothetical protein